MAHTIVLVIFLAPEKKNAIYWFEPGFELFLPWHSNPLIQNPFHEFAFAVKKQRFYWLKWSQSEVVIQNTNIVWFLDSIFCFILAHRTAKVVKFNEMQCDMPWEGNSFAIYLDVIHVRCFVPLAGLEFRSNKLAETTGTVRGSTVTVSYMWYISYIQVKYITYNTYIS